MTAKEYLQGIKKLDTQIRNKNAELQLAEKLRTADDEFVGEIEKQKRELRQKLTDIIKSIEQLPEAEYDVLHKVYVQYKTLYEVAADRGISYSGATSLHGQALKQLESLINANRC